MGKWAGERVTLQREFLLRDGTIIVTSALLLLESLSNEATVIAVVEVQ